MGHIPGSNYDPSYPAHNCGCGDHHHHHHQVTCCSSMVPPAVPSAKPRGCGCDHHHGIMGRENMHLFLEENCNSKNSFIRNVNIVAMNMQLLQSVFEHMCEIMTLACNMEALCMIAHHIDYVNFIAKNVDTIIAMVSQNTGLAYSFTCLMTVEQDQPTDCVITFNDENASYLPFSDTLMVSYNGCECYRGTQFEEIGEYGVLSNKVKMLFPLREGDQLLFRVINHN